MATESIREDDETTTARPWETVDLPEAPSDLSPYEQRKLEESKADSLMRREAASAQKGGSTIDAQLRTRPRVVQPVDENTTYGFQLSQSLNPERVYALAPDQHDDVRGYLTDASGFLDSVFTTLSKIDQAYRDLMLDKSLTPDARTQKLEAATSAAATKAYTGRAKAIEGLQKKIAHQDALLSSPLTAQAASPRSTELRAVLRTVKPAEVNASIRAALNAEHRTPQQAELLSATLGAHALTVGITEAEQAMHLRAFNEKSEPQVLRRLDLLKKALTIIEGIHPNTLVSQFEKSMRSKFSRASAISGISSKAAASLAAINGG